MMKLRLVQATLQDCLKGRVGEREGGRKVDGSWVGI